MKFRDRLVFGAIAKDFDTSLQTTFTTWKTETQPPSTTFFTQGYQDKYSQYHGRTIEVKKNGDIKLLNMAHDSADGGGLIIHASGAIGNGNFVGNNMEGSWVYEKLDGKKWIAVYSQGELLSTRYIC